MAKNFTSVDLEKCPREGMLAQMCQYRHLKKWGITSVKVVKLGSYYSVVLILFTEIIGDLGWITSRFG